MKVLTAINELCQTCRSSNSKTSSSLLEKSNLLVNFHVLGKLEDVRYCAASNMALSQLTSLATVFSFDENFLTDLSVISS